MADPIQVKIGPTAQADGTFAGRGGKTGEFVFTQAHGKYYEGASRGNMFSASEQGTGIAPGTALGTTAFFVLLNPAGSGKRLAIKKVRVSYISGTLGAGTLYHCVLGTVSQTAPSGGTLLVANNCDVGNAGVPVGVARVNATVVTPVAYAPLAKMEPELATSTNPLAILTDEMDGEIVLEPGCTYQIQAVAGAGTSPKLTAGVTWEEIAVV